MREDSLMLTRPAWCDSADDATSGRLQHHSRLCPLPPASDTAKPYLFTNTSVTALVTLLCR